MEIMTLYLIIMILAALVVLLPVMAVVFSMLLRRKFKHTLIIDELLGGSKRTLVKWCCDHYDRDSEAKNWRLFAEKDKLKRIAPLPPNDMISSDKKGRNVAYCIRTETGDYIYKNPNIIVKPLPGDLYDNMPDDLINIKNEKERQKKIDEWRKKKRDEWYQVNKVDIAIKAFTPNQRLIQMNNYKKAVERRRTDWLQHIPAIVGGIIFVMSMVVIIIIATMWSDLTKPGMEAQQEHTRQLEIYERTAQTLANIDSRVQKIESQEPGSGTKAPN